MLVVAPLARAEGPAFGSVPATTIPASPELPPPGDPVSLVLDDGTAENNIGLNDTAAASMFEWMNRFTPTEFPIEVSRIDIYWDSGYVSPAFPIELAVYEGGSDPCGGSAPTLLGAEVALVAAVDTFDQYPLAVPVTASAGPDVYLGVVDRWVESGVTPPTYPAALDTTATQARSFVASWSTDPPSPPVLPPDALCGTIDSFGFPGNWLIRGAGTVVPVELMQMSVE